MRDTILITGGAGFIGSWLVRQTVREEPRTTVVNFDKLTYAGDLDSLGPVVDHPRHVFVRGDVADIELACELMQRWQPRAVIHLAAESHVDRSIDDPAAFIKTNVVGTFSMLDAARRYWNGLPAEGQGRFRFLHVSTDEVYGTLGPSGAFTEATAYAPRSPYSASKAAADHLVRSYHATYGLPTLITNSSNNYGPGQFPEKLIPLVTLNALEGKKLPVYGDGLQVRDWLYVEDHCEALRLVLQRGVPGETYNIGANCERTNLAIVKQVCRLVDGLRGPGEPPSERLIEHVVERPGHDRRYAIDASKVRAAVGWTPRHDFDEALAHTVRWYYENAAWVERITGGTYQRQRLGIASAA